MAMNPSFLLLDHTKELDAPSLFRSLQCQCLYNYSHLFSKSLMIPLPDHQVLLFRRVQLPLRESRRLSPSVVMSLCSWLVASFWFTHLNSARVCFVKELKRQYYMVKLQRK